MDGLISGGGRGGARGMGKVVWRKKAGYKTTYQTESNG